MNTKIIRRLNNAAATQTDPDGTLKKTAQEITESHNNAVLNGFLELPLLNFIAAYKDGNQIGVAVLPKSNCIDIDDLYNLKTEWGADNLLTCFNNNSSEIELIFNKK